MSLNTEWRNRLKRFREAMDRLIYTPSEEISFDGFSSLESYRPDTLPAEKFSPMPEGTKWGAKWEYAWFKSSILVSEELAGKRLALKLDTGAESAVFINGTQAGAIDREHNYIHLNGNQPANEGDSYDILVHSYAGHGAWVVASGWVEPGRETVPEPEDKQRTVKKSTLGIFNEDIFQLIMDVNTLFQVRESLDCDSLEVAVIDEALKDMMMTVDFELPYSEMMKTLAEGRKILSTPLSARNGSIAPKLYCFGHSHIDVAWLWPLEETYHKCERTFATQLELCEMYPEFRFLQSQAYLYQKVKEKYPKLYARVKEAIKKGQFMPDGAMWVEPDTNIAGGEALIRQFIHGKRFFKEEFGVDSKLCWLPDVFGYTGAFPQIMAGCEVEAFGTTKLFSAYNGGNLFPYHTFLWQGIDGTRILSCVHNSYDSKTEPQILIERWKTRVQKDGINKRLFPFGYGDGGGGPTREHLEYLRRCNDLQDVPKTEIIHPMDFFYDTIEEGVPDECYVGELYYEAHRGTYTSQAKTKLGNRRSEMWLREAEMWGTFAAAVNGYDFTTDTLDEAWKLLLVNQFHDILPGSSIKRVYDEAEADFEKIISTAKNETQNATAALTEKKDALTVFNSLSFSDTKLVALPDGWEGAKIGEDTLICQDGFCMVDVPSCGYTTIYPAESDKTKDIKNSPYNVLENEFIRAEINDCGELVSVYDKKACRETLRKSGNVFCMYKDITAEWDAWEIDSMYEKTPVELSRTAEVTKVSDGPLFSSIQVKRKINDSALTQTITLAKNKRRIDFKTVIDWKESHKLLKVAFPTNIDTNEVLNEIQFGYIKRPNHRSTSLDKAKFEITNHKWSALCEGMCGAAVLNDSKYGLNVKGNVINLTLLKSAKAPDMNADLGIQKFTYSYMPYNGPFETSGVVQEALMLNAPTVTKPGAKGTESLMSIDKASIIIDTVKPAEDGSGDIIVRMYDAYKTSGEAALNTVLPVKSAAITNMLEEKGEDVKVDSGKIKLHFRPFEVKTLRLKL